MQIETPRHELEGFAGVVDTPHGGLEVPAHDARQRTDAT